MPKNNITSDEIYTNKTITYEQYRENYLRNSTVEKVKMFNFDNIISKAKKEFGYIKKGDESDYDDELLEFESILIASNRENNEFNSRRAEEAIKICIFRMLGYLNMKQYDFSAVAEDISIEVANKLCNITILMEDEEIFNYIANVDDNPYDIFSHDGLKEFFEDDIKMLIRIHESIEYWTKEGDTQTYFAFLSEFIPYEATLLDYLFDGDSFDAEPINEDIYDDELLNEKLRLLSDIVFKGVELSQEENKFLDATLESDVKIAQDLVRKLFFE